MTTLASLHEGKAAPALPRTFTVNVLVDHSRRVERPKMLRLCLTRVIVFPTPVVVTGHYIVENYSIHP